jgi:putative ABC transport system ATP-binding protein
MIHLASITKTYVPAARRGVDAAEGVDGVAPTLDGVTWDVAEGETVVVVGESGSGKTTLLNLIAGLDRPTSGRIAVAGQCLNDLDDDGLARLRREAIGLVFQNYHLENSLTAIENVELPLLLDDVDRGEAARRAREALEMVKMDGFAEKPVSLLSGGQCQRIVVARALVRRPRLLLADEPTANLDEETARALFRLLDEYQRREKATLVLVSHDRLALEHPDRRRARCEGGKVVRME